MTNYRTMLDTATDDIREALGLNPYAADAIGLRDMIRTIYAAASNANAISEDPAFARMIFTASCDQAMVLVIIKCAKIFEFELSRTLKDLTPNPFLVIIGDLFND